MAQIYLETSFISACVTDRTDPASIYRRASSLDWWTSQRDKHDLYISAEVVRELAHPGFSRGQQALQWVRDIPLLDINADVEGLAALLVNEKVMPGPVAGDAIHVAAATVYGIEYLMTWNVRHLANVNKLQHLRVICRRLGLVPPDIVVPDLLWED